SPPRSTLFPYPTLFRSNPAIANLHRLLRRRRNSPVGGQFLYWKNLRETIRPFQMKRFVFFLENERHAIREHLKRSGGLMFAHIRSEEHTSELQSPDHLV